MNFFNFGYHKKYIQLLDNVIKVLDKIENYLQDSTLTNHELKLLVKIYVTLSKKDAETLVKIHKKALLEIKGYNKLVLAHRRNVYIPMIEKELKNLNKSKTNEK